MVTPTTTQYTLEQEDKSRDASFSKVLHGKVNERGGIASMFGKDSASKKEAVDEYFKHWDNKAADVETEETRKARRDEYATLTRHYYNLGMSILPFPSCRFSAGSRAGQLCLVTCPALTCHS
jgi:sterol 24-C-methyltransferase